MSTKLPDEQFLSRWMKGELSEAEEADWKASEGYRQWQRIQAALERRALPKLDKEEAYRQLSESLPAQKPPSKAYTLRWAVGIAATFALVIAYFFLQPNETSWKTPVAQQQNIQLPDGSSAQLNADSRLSYKSSPISGKRRVALNGEAFFRVNPGEAFIVSTPLGKVEVLGTRFNVLGRTQQFQVYCTEGKVQVDYNNKRYVLEAGQGIRPLSETTVYKHQKAEAEWANGASQFENRPLPFVFDELERQYGIEIRYTGLSGRRYTGRFPHNDLENALSIVCSAMNLSFTFISDKIVQIEAD